VQILDGEKPANTAPIRVDFVPGTKFRYSGGGITIEQTLMIDVTGKAFPSLMKELVLAKIGMSDSSYEQPLPAEWRNARRPEHTETANWFTENACVSGNGGGGFVTTPTDLASSRLRSRSRIRGNRTKC